MIELYVTPFDKMMWNNVEESTVTNLRSESVIGFAVVVWDHDPHEQLAPWVHRGIDGPGVVTMTFWEGDQFMDGVLLPASGELEDDSAVKSDSWARIKASFGDESIDGTKGADTLLTPKEVLK